MGAGAGGGIKAATAAVCRASGDTLRCSMAGAFTGVNTGCGNFVGEVFAGAGASTICNSSAPSRLSFQGKFSPGNPNPCPPKVMLNRSVWSAREINSAVFSRQGPC